MRHQNKLSLFGAVRALTLGTAFLSAILSDKSQAEVIESTTEDIGEANASEAADMKGGSRCNKLENVTTFVNSTAIAFNQVKAYFKELIAP